MDNQLGVILYISVWSIINIIFCYWAQIINQRESVQVVPITSQEPNVNTQSIKLTTNQIQKSQQGQEYEDFFNMDTEKQQEDAIETPSVRHSKHSPRLPQTLPQTQDLELNTPLSKREERPSLRRERKATVKLADGSTIDCFNPVQRSKKKKNSYLQSSNTIQSTGRKKTSLFQKQHSKQFEVQKEQMPIKPISYSFYNEYNFILYGKTIINKKWQILVIYFRQLLCFDINSFLLSFEFLTYYYVLGISIIIVLIFKIIDKQFMIFLNKDQVKYGQCIKILYILLWFAVFAAFIALTFIIDMNDDYQFISYLPSLILDILLLDPIYMLLRKYCINNDDK